jgi:ABC-type branched-subunit amino acid transport system ATPase component
LASTDPAAAGAAAVTLAARSLTKSFGGVRAVDDLSVSFAAGTISALVGPNGAGKTTLFHLLSGSLRPERGEVWLRLRRIDRLPPWQVARLGIGRLFQDVRVFPRLTVEENVLVAFPSQLGENLVWPLLRRRATCAQERAREQAAAELLSRVGLQELAREPAERLSYGQQKLLAITRLLAADADVLLLDEPTAGISPAASGPLLELVRWLADGGKTVILIEHDMSVVQRLANLVYFMDRGRITAAGSAGEVLGKPEVRAHYLGM